MNNNDSYKNNDDKNKCYNRSIGIETWNYDRQANWPTEQPSDRHEGSSGSFTSIITILILTRIKNNDINSYLLLSVAV